VTKSKNNKTMITRMLQLVGGNMLFVRGTSFLLASMAIETEEFVLVAHAIHR
jgi:hypothetical protein